MAMVERGLGRRKEADEHLARARHERVEHFERSLSAGVFFDPGSFEYNLMIGEAEATLRSPGGSS
jgi:hypothetical protein